MTRRCRRGQGVNTDPEGLGLRGGCEGAARGLAGSDPPALSALVRRVPEAAMKAAMLEGLAGEGRPELPGAAGSLSESSRA